MHFNTDDQTQGRQDSASHTLQPRLRPMMKYQHYLAAGICGFVVLSEFADAAEKKDPKKGKTAQVAVALTDAGKALEAQYAAKMQALKAEIETALPKPDEAKTATWLEAIKAEEVTAKDSADKAGAVAKMKSTIDKLNQVQESGKKAPRTYAEAKEELVQIKAVGGSNPELEKLLESEAIFQAHTQKEQAQLQDQIAKAMAEAKSAEAQLPEAVKAAAAAKQVHEKTMATTWQAMDALGMSGILGSDSLDGKLAQYTVIKDATPSGLAQFSEKSPGNAKLVQELLSNEALMIQMLVADGPNSGKYGEAMKIYTDIQKASASAKDGLFQRLALAVSLAHAMPIEKRASVGGDSKEGDETVAGSNGSANAIDPVKRYLSYEKWYLDGELDPGFKDLSVWNLAMAVDGSDPDEVLAWGRKMLDNLRPDCIPRNGDTSIYVDIVDKEIAYTSSMVKEDRPELAFMQNILSNGGVCGRRAFFGRFTLQAFGIPTAARKEPGHATLAHWHPHGWATRLGGTSKPGEDWRPGGRGFYASMNDSRSGPYGADVNFHASSRSREDATAFMRVKRAQWTGALLDEQLKPGLITWSGKTRGPAPKKKGEIEKPIFWNELALHEQRRIIAGLKKSGASGSSSTTAVAAMAPAATGKITIDDKGVITIPSAASSNPSQSIRKGSRHGLRDIIVFVENKAGETHLHLSRYATEADSFEYAFDALKAGKYKLEADVVTPRPNQILFTSVNGGADVEWTLPYTMGMWDKATPVVIELKAGGNVLKFRGPGRVTLGQFTLTPMN
jgi:hypothetical protein